MEASTVRNSRGNHKQPDNVLISDRKLERTLPSYQAKIAVLCAVRADLWLAVGGSIRVSTLGS